LSVRQGANPDHSGLTGLTCKYWTRLKKADKDKRSSLFLLGVSSLSCCTGKCFCLVTGTARAAGDEWVDWAAGQPGSDGNPIIKKQPACKDLDYWDKTLA